MPSNSTQATRPAVWRARSQPWRPWGSAALLTLALLTALLCGLAALPSGARAAVASTPIAGGVLTSMAMPSPVTAQPTYPFQDPRLPLNARIDDLVGRLTLDEKIPLLHQYQPATPRLGIPLFKAGTEAIHGVAWSCDYNDNGNVVTATDTVFPQAVGMASTWDPRLIQRVGSVVGDEARGYNVQNPVVWGLNLWAPVVNLLRDPRWGRNEEGYSEDPTLTGAISTAYGSGLEGNDPRYLKTAPTLKHYLAYNNEVQRDVTSSNVPARVLNEYDRQAFKPAISANAATGVMASYNLVNGRPATVSPDLNDVVRSWTSKTLFNVSDAYAPYNLTVVGSVGVADVEQGLARPAAHHVVEVGADGGGAAVDQVVRSHHPSRRVRRDRRLERLPVILVQHPGRDVGRGHVALDLVVVREVMLQGRCRLQVARVVALQARAVGRGDRPGQRRVLGVALLVTAPARVT